MTREYPYHCPGCQYGMAITDEKYSCSHPSFGKKGKMIYPEAFKVLKVLGCMGSQ